MNKNIKELHNKEITWVNVSAPKEKETEYLKNNYNFHPLDIKSCLPPLQRPKMVERREYLFIIFTFPVFNRHDGEIKIAEIDFFLTPKSLITVHDNTLPPLKNLFKTCQDNKNGEKEKILTNPLMLLYEILHRLFNYCFPMLLHTSDDLLKLNDKIFNDQGNKMIKEISAIKLNIVNFRKAVQAHKNVIKKLIDAAPRLFPETRSEIYFEHLKEKTKEIWDLLENDKDTVNALSQTHDSLISFRINDIIKTLTLFSVIVFPLTLLAAIFGMNAKAMPLIDLHYGFWIIIGIMLAGILGMILFFKKKKWL